MNPKIVATMQEAHRRLTQVLAGVATASIDTTTAGNSLTDTIRVTSDDTAHTVQIDWVSEDDEPRARAWSVIVEM